MKNAVYKACFDKVRDGGGNLAGGKFVAMVLYGPQGSAFPPNTIYKRISRKAYETKAEAVLAAKDWIEKKSLPVWEPKK